MPDFAPGRPLALALALALVGSAASAQAQEAAPRLTWSAPADCPSQQDVHAEVARLTPSAPPSARLSLDSHAIVIQSIAGRWLGLFRIEQDGFVGERQIEADSCAEVAHAFALVVALAIDPTLAPAPSPPAPPAAAPLPPTAAGPTPATPTPAGPTPATPTPATSTPAGSTPTTPTPAKARPPEAPSPRVSIVWVAGAGLRLQTGLLPGLAPGFGIDVGARRGRQGLYVNGIFLPERESEITGLREAQGRYELLAAGLTGCQSWPLGDFEVDACARTRWGSASAQSKGVTRESSGRGLWGSVGAVGALRVPLGPRSALRVEFEGGASLRRPRFVIQNAGAGHEWPSFYTGAAFGAELLF